MFEGLWTNLAHMYYEGQGVSEDYAKAIELYQFSAAQGFSRAQTNLGHMYENDEGSVQDEVKAVKWHLRAANQREDLAQGSLGLVHFEGRWTDLQR